MPSLFLIFLVAKYFLIGIRVSPMYYSGIESHLLFHNLQASRVCFTKIIKCFLVYRKIVCKYHRIYITSLKRAGGTSMYYHDEVIQMPETTRGWLRGKWFLCLGWVIYQKCRSKSRDYIKTLSGFIRPNQANV